MAYKYNPFTNTFDITGTSGGGISGTNWTHGIVVDGGGAAITTGSKGFFRVPYACTVMGWTVLADQVGSIVVDVKKGSYASFPTTSSIAGAEKPKLSLAQNSQNVSLTTWTPTLAVDDVLESVVDSIATIQRATVLLHVQRT